MVAVLPGSDEWLAMLAESIVDPERPIVDPHHHLWDRPGSTYVLENLWADTGSGHNVIQTVFIECRASYREDGPAHFKPVGETVFVESIASASRLGKGAEIAAMVSHADLRSPDLDEVLDAHEEAVRGEACRARKPGLHGEVEASEEKRLGHRRPQGPVSSLGRLDRQEHPVLDTLEIRMDRDARREGDRARG